MICSYLTNVRPRTFMVVSSRGSSNRRDVMNGRGHRLASIVFALSLLAAPLGCSEGGEETDVNIEIEDDAGPLEEAGEAMDEATEAIGEAGREVRETGEAVGEAGEDVGEQMEDAVGE
ncbi:MAG: hypothetical protein P8Y29_07040 [Gemmatimonadota bacterium]